MGVMCPQGIGIVGPLEAEITWEGKDEKILEMEGGDGCITK